MNLVYQSLDHVGINHRVSHEGVTEVLLRLFFEVVPGMLNAIVSPSLFTSVPVGPT